MHFAARKSKQPQTIVQDIDTPYVSGIDLDVTAEQINAPVP